MPVVTPHQYPVRLGQLLSRPELHDLCLGRVQSQASGSKPGFNVDEARVQTLDGHRCVIGEYTQIQLGTVCILMNVQHVRTLLTFTSLSMQQDTYNISH